MPKSNSLLFLLLLALLVSSKSVTAQKERIFSVGISILDEHVGLPFEYLPGNSDNSFNPGVALSFESRRERSGIYQFSHVLELGYYFHAENEQVGYVALKPRFGLRFVKAIDVHLIPGLGYAHSFPTVQSFSQLSDRYVLSSHNGKSHFMPSLGVGVGFDLEPLSGLPIRLHIRHESMVLLPAIHTLSHAGILYSF